MLSERRESDAPREKLPAFWLRELRAEAVELVRYGFRLWPKHRDEREETGEILER